MLPKLTFSKSLEPVEQPVEYDGREYALTEVDVPGVSEYKSAAAASVKFDDKGGMSRIGGAGDLDPLLVSLSLKEVYDDKGTRKLRKVSRAFVNTLPPLMVKELATAAKDINPALDETPTVEALDKQITKLTELRVRLAGGEDTPKN
jgi:hypothetical protein